MDENKELNELLEPYRIALKLEKEGRQLFLDVAKKTTSFFARQTFEFLAKEEEKHIKHIEKFYKTLVESKGENVLDVDVSNADEKLETFNLKLEALKDEYQTMESDVEAYQLALKFENGAEEFYQKMYEKSVNPNIKKFYQWLILEESMHGRLIKSCLKFIQDPTEWFKTRKKEF